MFFVAVYMVDRAYGGPEEGGWWYDCGELITDADLLKENGIALPTAYSEESLAERAVGYANHLLNNTLNVGRREISSVISTGRYMAMVFENELPHHFPTVRPRYE